MSTPDSVGRVNAELTESDSGLLETIDIRDHGGMRVAIRVKPGSSRVRVGGPYGEGDDARLVVAVTAKATDGKATAAAVKAVARAFTVPPRAVHLVYGATSRNKRVEIDTSDDERLAARLAELLDG